MKHYIVDDNGMQWSFESKERAEKKAEELGTEVREKTAWRYYAPYYTCGTSNYREITGKNLCEAIEKNFDKIIKDFSLGSAAGLKLKSAKIIPNGDSAKLEIVYRPLGKLGVDDKLEKSKTVEIEWVAEGDLEEEYNFPIEK